MHRDLIQLEAIRILRVFVSLQGLGSGRRMDLIVLALSDGNSRVPWKAADTFFYVHRPSGYGAQMETTLAKDMQMRDHS